MLSRTFICKNINIINKLNISNINININNNRKYFSTVIYTWGNAESGCLGHNKFDDITIEPRRLINSKKYKQIICGEKFSYVIDNNGLLYGFGKGPTKLDSNIPINIPLNDKNIKFIKITAGKTFVFCIDNNNNLYSFGKQSVGFFSSGGQLGHGNKLNEIDEPKLLTSLKEYGAKIADVACGAEHTLILTDDGEVLSCGVGEYGRLGTGSSKDLYIPNSLESLNNVVIKQVAAGVNHSMALSNDGKVYTWGRNDAGQLGFKDTFIDIYSMEEFPRILDQSLFNNEKIKYISASSYRSAAITESGKLYIWGRQQNHYPTLIESSNDFTNNLRVKKILLGYDENDKHCALLLTDDGTCWSYGNSKTNMLGNIYPKAVNTNTPEKIKSLIGKNVLDIAIGIGHCAAMVESND